MRLAPTDETLHRCGCANLTSTTASARTPSRVQGTLSPRSCSLMRGMDRQNRNITRRGAHQSSSARRTATSCQMTRTGSTQNAPAMCACAAAAPDRDALGTKLSKSHPRCEPRAVSAAAEQTQHQIARHGAHLHNSLPKLGVTT